ncbi:MAG: hypothetical protein IPK90_08115 [Chitinophagaceae bacterium]|nr:hypothetical protein [Chitinophagaceae bacterium]
MSVITIAKPQIEIDASIKSLVQEETERCTIVHCRLYTNYLNRVRIWPETYLVEEDGNRKKMIKAFNISLMPYWTAHRIINGQIRFSLVFEGLSRNCDQFFLLEDIPEPKGFYSNKIHRNITDVYQAEILIK